MLEYMLRDTCYGEAWLDVAKHSDKWQAVVNTVMNSRAP